MKRVMFLLITMVLLSSSAFAGSFVSGSTGVDGAFNPTTNTELQMPANGIFNFTTVNIPAGVTVTFKKNDANTPVYILATGDVTIVGSFNVDGKSGNAQYPGKGGPGGFDGGFGGVGSGGTGLGSGAGKQAVLGGSYPYGNGGGGAGFGTGGGSGQYCGCGGSAGGAGGTYGNSTLMPLIGGSGGGGGAGTWQACTGGAGGGGGGAILIASSATITVTGAINANGSGGRDSIVNDWCTGSGGGGSGGAIRLIANVIAGNGTISAAGAGGGYNGHDGGSGGLGRIRLETNSMVRTSGTNPAYVAGWPTTVFVANIPTIKITSIGGIAVPESPSGTFGTPDVMLPVTTTNPVAVGVSATNIPVGTTVAITSVPEYGSAVSATSTGLSGTFASSTATANMSISVNYKCILTATATFTVQTAMFYDGEKIEKVRVASKIGGDSEVVYITEKGREIPAEKLMASIK